MIKKFAVSLAKFSVMDNYVVSARKYRPLTFDSVVGQDAITLTLKNAIKNNQLAQAFLFCGPRGVGKTTCARILAKTINCMNIKDNYEACDECESCKSFNQNASFNIHELDAASNNSVADIRNLVDQVRIPPQVGKYKIYIIDEVHMLSQAAFNAFLKTLEEPPAYAKFILATTEKNKIIPTILSRCQVFDFKRITIEDIVKHLVYVAQSEGIEAEVQALHTIAQKSDGGMRDALSLFDQLVSFSGKNLTYKKVIESLNILDYEYYFKMIDYILAGDTKNILLTINTIFDNGFEGSHFIIGFNEHLRSLLVSKDSGTITLLNVSENIKNRYVQQAAKCSMSFLVQAINIINKCDIDYKLSSNKQLLVEVALLNIQQLTDEKKKPDISANKSITVEKVVIQQADASMTSTPSPAVEKTSLKNKTNETEVIQNTASTDETIIHKRQTGKGVIKHPTMVRLSALKEDTLLAEEEANKPQPPSALRSKHFTIDDVNEVVKKYIRNIDGSKIHLSNVLQTSIVSLQEDDIVEFQVTNGVSEQEIKDNKLDIACFLRDTLENDSINISTKVNEILFEKKAYTDKEKFQKLLDKNPDLLYLRSKLKLEIEF